MDVNGAMFLWFKSRNVNFKFILNALTVHNLFCQNVCIVWAVKVLLNLVIFLILGIMLSGKKVVQLEMTSEMVQICST